MGTYLRLSDDPTVKTVLLEDSAALLGLLLAFGGSGCTGSGSREALASLAIACSPGSSSSSAAPTPGC